jgi:hypothetical protein
MFEPGTYQVQVPGIPGSHMYICTCGYGAINAFDLVTFMVLIVPCYSQGIIISRPSQEIMFEATPYYLLVVRQYDRKKQSAIKQEF